MQLITRLQNKWKDSVTIRNLFRVSLGDGASKLFSVATAFLLIRGLSVADYANYITFSGISSLFSGIIGVGINLALVRFATYGISTKKEKPLSLYLFAIFFQVLIYGLLAGLCLSFPIQSTTILFGQPALDLPLRFGLLAGLGILMVQFSRSLYQAEEKFDRYVGMIWIVQIIIFVCLVVVWLFDSLSFQPVAIIFATAQFGIGLLVLIRYLGNHHISELKDSFGDQKGQLKSFLAGSGWLIGYFLVLNFFSRTDILMLMRFTGEEAVAVYGVAFQYYSLALLFLGSIHAVLLPKFSKEEMQKQERQKAFLRQWLRWSIWLLIPIIVFDAFGKPIFVWLNGNTYERSFPILIIFSIGIWLSMMFSPLVNILIGRGEYRFLFVVACFALVFNIASNILIIPSFGGLGAALVVVLTQNVVIQVPILLKGLRPL